MPLLLATIVLAAFLRGIGALGVSALSDWRAAVRLALSLFFCFTGIAHFTTTRADLINMVPPSFPNPPLLVTLSGFAEIAGGIGLMLPRSSRLAAMALILLLIVLFPANVYAAREGVIIAGFRHPSLIERGFMQLAWIGMLWFSRGRGASDHFNRGRS